jgi:hypothetical protein
MQKRHTKATSKVTHVVKRQEQAQMEVQWEEIKQWHDLAVAAWELECEQLTATGTRDLQEGLTKVSCPSPQAQGGTAST